MLTIKYWADVTYCRYWERVTDNKHVETSALQINLNKFNDVILRESAKRKKRNFKITLRGILSLAG
jgi:hypothetical protein